MRILGLGGSLREESRTLGALRIALEGAAQASVQTSLLDLKELDLPLYDDRRDIATYPKPVFRLLEEARQTEGLILATPVYHGTLSGAMKNALDFLELLANDDPPWLSGKVVGLISVAGGSSGTNAINSLIFACQALRAWILPRAVCLPGGAFGSDGQLQDSRLKERLLKLGKEVAEHAEVFARERENLRETS